MTHRLSLTGWALAAMMLLPAPASLGAEVSLSFKDGKVTLVARDATLDQIFKEWERVGRTKFVIRETLPRTPVTLDLVGVPEAKAIATLLRSVSGYVAAPRQTPVVDAALYDRVFVMAGPSRPAAPPSAAPARPNVQQPPFRNPLPGEPNPYGPVGIVNPNDDSNDDLPSPLQQSMPFRQQPPGFPQQGGMPPTVMPNPTDSQSAGPDGVGRNPQVFGAPPVPKTLPTPGMIPTQPPKPPGIVPGGPPRPPGH